MTPRGYEHKEVLSKFSNACVNCGVKNYSLVTLGEEKGKWKVHPDFIKGADNYYFAKDAVKIINEEEKSPNWGVIVLSVKEMHNEFAPVCALCAGKSISIAKLNPPKYQSQLF